MKSEYARLPDMAARPCQVTVTDTNGVAHSVDVTAASVFEAVVMELAAIRGSDLAEAISEGFSTGELAPTMGTFLEMPAAEAPGRS